MTESQTIQKYMGLESLCGDWDLSLYPHGDCFYIQGPGWKLMFDDLRGVKGFLDGYIRGAIDEAWVENGPN